MLQSYSIRHTAGVRMELVMQYNKVVSDEWDCALYCTIHS